MIVLTNPAAQVVAPGAAVVFTQITRRSNRCGCCTQNGTTSAPRLTNRGVYEVSFSGNVGGDTAGTQVQLSIQLGGITLPETLMISTPAAVGDLNNVAKTTYVNSGCCADMGRVTVVNTGTVAVNLGANPALAITYESN